MYKFNKILVGLDQTEMDKELIHSAAAICDLSDSKQIFFVNVIRNFNLPDEVLKEFPGMLESAIEDRKHALQQDVDQYFRQEKASAEVKVIVKQGPATKTILNFANSERVDLIILGRKSEKKTGGVLVTRVARRAGCSLLIMPKTSTFSLKSILVPTDFSSYSQKALEKAVTFARRSTPRSKVIIQNVYQVPVGYHYTGKSYEEFDEIMKSNARKDYQKFISKVKTDKLQVQELYTLDKDDDVIADIYGVAKKLKVNIIIIGAKGRTATTALFIGSKAERLIQVNEKIPMLVIRPKGKRAGFLELLKDL